MQSTKHIWNLTKQSKKLIGYKVIELGKEDALTAYILDGWSLCGGVCATDRHLRQAIVKYAKN